MGFYEFFDGLGIGAGGIEEWGEVAHVEMGFEEGG